MKPCEPEEFKDCGVVFSGLDSFVTGEIEMAFLKANLVVFSYAKNYRQDPLVSLVVPTVNLDHFDVILQSQRSHFKSDKVFLVCNSNCAVIGLAIPFAAMEAAFGPVDAVSVTTEQALSGEKHISNAYMRRADSYQARAILACFQWISWTTWYLTSVEKKRRWGSETRKILGHVNKEDMSFIQRSDLKVSATYTRLDVTDGHMAFVSLRFTKGRRLAQSK